MPIISVDGLCKRFCIAKRKTGWLGAVTSLFSREYVTRQALDEVSFEVNEGELVGYIGPNGAGKSTTVKILSGILVPDEGRVSVFGKTPWEHRIETVRQLGVVFGQRTQLWWDLPVMDSFELLRDIYKIPPDEYRRNLNLLVDILHLASLCDTPVRQLSLGQRMRCDLAASLLHSPKILFLDEPTIGLDAVSKLAVRDFIRQLNREHGTTLLLTTHDMDDIESLCSRVLILNQGKIYLDGSLDDLRKKMAPERRLIIDLTHAQDEIFDSEATMVKREGHRIWLSFNPMQTPAPKLISRITAMHAIEDLYIENPPIEEIIARFYRDANL